MTRSILPAIRNIREAVADTSASAEEGEYETKIVLVGTSTIEDDTVETTTLTVMEKGKQHLAKIEDTIHVISDKTKVPTWGIVLAVFMVVLLILLIIGLVIWKVVKKFKKGDGKGLKSSMLGNSMQLLRGSFKDKDKGEGDTEELTKNMEGDNKDKPAEEDEADFGELEFSIDYDFAKQELAVSCLQCQNLPAMDMGGTSDPYVKIFILPEKKKKFETKVHRKTLNPVYNETFIFKEIEYADIGDKTLAFQIFDYDRFSKHDQIGELYVPMSSIDLGKVVQEWRDVLPPANDDDKPVELGEICFSLRYVPNTGKLTVCVLEAKNLKQMDLGGFSDPFVKVALYCGKKKLAKKKTTIQKGTLNPYYNEAFTFEIPNDQMTKVHIFVTVYDYDLIGSSDPIGKCSVGLNQTGQGQSHWMDMMNTPRRPIANWHTLRDPEEPKPEPKKKEEKK